MLRSQSFEPSLLGFFGRTCSKLDQFKLYRYLPKLCKGWLKLEELAFNFEPGVLFSTVAYNTYPSERQNVRFLLKGVKRHSKNSRQIGLGG